MESPPSTTTPWIGLQSRSSLTPACSNGVTMTWFPPCLPVQLTSVAAISGSATTGTWIDSSDETGRKWQHTSDALGRLTEVMEPDGSSTVGKTPSVETDYAYDALSNLLEVDQWGGAKNNGTYTDHKRTFTYNSLSQLLTSTNPESGTISYAYDANGNVSTKTEPAQNVASGTVTVSYAYDNLNWLTEKSYSDGVTPTAYLGYDLESVHIGSARVTTTNVIGRPSWNCVLIQTTW